MSSGCAIPTPSAPQWAAHTSFADPTSGADAAPRQSIEVRTLALF